MATQMSSARRGIATDEMKQVAKDEDVTLDWLLPKIAIYGYANELCKKRYCN